MEDLDNKMWIFQSLKRVVFTKYIKCVQKSDFGHVKTATNTFLNAFKASKITTPD